MPDVLMPRLSDTMEEGVISRWLKHEGDAGRKRATCSPRSRPTRPPWSWRPTTSGVLDAVLVHRGHDGADRRADRGHRRRDRSRQAPDRPQPAPGAGTAAAAPAPARRLHPPAPHGPAPARATAAGAHLSARPQDCPRTRHRPAHDHRHRARRPHRPRGRRGRPRRTPTARPPARPGRIPVTPPEAPAAAARATTRAAADRDPPDHGRTADRERSRAALLPHQP